MTSEDRSPSATSKNNAFSTHSTASGAASATVAFLLLPAAAMLAVGVAVNGLNATTVVVVLGVVGASIAIVIAVRRTAAFITCSTDEVVVGFAPYWRTRLRPASIAAVEAVSVDAFAEWGGWGVKGSARGAQGRLYSAGGTHGVRLQTSDGLTYVVAFSDRVDAERAVAAVTRVIG